MAVIFTPKEVIHLRKEALKLYNEGVRHHINFHISNAYTFQDIKRTAINKRDMDIPEKFFLVAATFSCGYYVNQFYMLKDGSCLFLDTDFL